MAVTWAVTQLWLIDTPKPNTVSRVAFTATHSGAGGVVSSNVDIGDAHEFLIAYASLTESQVLSWVWRYIDKAAIETLLERRATESAAGALPWA